MAARGAAVKAGAAVAAAAAAAAECRERQELGSLILEPEDPKEWHLLEAADVAEATKMVGSLMPASVAGEAALDLAKRMAHRPAVQEALADELGLSRRASLGEMDLREAIANLTIENDALRAQNASARAMLDERERLSASTDTLVDQLSLQNEALAATYLQEEPEESVEDESVEDEAGQKAQELADLALAQKIAKDEADIESARQEQILADLAFAQHLADPLDDKPPKDQSEVPLPKKNEDDEEDSTLIEIALALAGIIVLVALTRKISPFLAKRAAMLSAAALAGIAAKFKCG